MTMYKHVLALVLSLFAFAAVADNPKFTWTGGAGPLSDGEWAGYYSWKDANNWDAAGVPTACGMTGSTAGVYDFTALAANAKIVCDSGVNHCMGHITFAGNLGAVEIVSATDASNIAYFSGATLTVPTGTKVLWGLNKAAATSDYFPTLTLTGGGEFRITATGSYSVYRHRLNITANTTLGVDSSVADLRTLTINFQASTAKLDLGCDVVIGAIMGDVYGAAQIALNGHSLRLAMGYAPVANDVWQPGNVTTNYFKPIGSGSVVYAGGRVFENLNPQEFIGPLMIENADVATDFGFPNATAIDIANSGVLTLGTDQSVAALAGEGATGGIVLKDGATLTVNDSSADPATYAARLSGAGAFVKDGSNELVLSGANVLTGPTTVKGGTLTVKGAVSAMAEEAALLHAYRFEDALTDDAGSINAKFTYYYKPDGGSAGDQNDPPPGTTATTFCVGRRGTRGVELASGSYASVQVADGAKGIGTGPFTVTVWTVPSADFCRQEVNYGMTALLFLGSGANTAYNSCKVYLVNGTNISYSVGDYTVKPVSQKDGLGFDKDLPYDQIYDGNWHMVTLTYSGEETRVLSGYFDGEFMGSKEIIGGTVTLSSRLHIGWGMLGSAAGKFDDFKVLTRCQSAAEIKNEYLGEVAAGDDFASLPAPVAHWAFDDAENPGKDSSGNGYNLAAYTGYSASVTEVDGAYGKALAKDSPMFLATIPEKIPTGNKAWTVSARYMVDGIVQGGNVNNPSVLFWGDNRLDTKDFSKNANKFMQLTVSNAGPDTKDTYRVLRPALKYGNAKYCTLSSDDVLSETYNSMYKAGKANWVNLVVVWDPKEKKFFGYVDGVLLGTVTRTQLDLCATGRLLVGLRPGYGNETENVEVPFKGYIDDIRVFDTAFTAEQVMTLTRGLKDGTVGAPLSAASDLTVASGATLKVEGTGHAAKSLAGAGMLNLTENSSLAVGGGSVGTLTGLGQLAISAPLKATSAAAYYGNVVLSGSGTLDAADYTGAVTLPDPYAASLASVAALPLVRTAGTVTFPAEGTLTFPSLPESVTDTLVAEAGRLVLPANFSGWTIEPDHTQGHHSKLYVRDGKVYLKRKPKTGHLLILR